MSLFCLRACLEGTKVLSLQCIDVLFCFFSCTRRILMHWHTFLLLCSYRFGRKSIFLISCVLNAVTGILVAVSPNYISLLVFRALFGFGTKGGWMVAFVLSKNTSSHAFSLLPKGIFWKVTRRYPKRLLDKTRTGSTIFFKVNLLKLLNIN